MGAMRDAVLDGGWELDLRIAGRAGIDGTEGILCGRPLGDDSVDGD